MRPALLALAALLAAGCAERGADGGWSADPAAPFFGPAERAVEPIPPIAAPPIAAIPPLPALPETVPANDDAARRREIWTTSKFRCRAISTTRLRTCALAPSPRGASITFPVADLKCDEVVFDAAGDPSELRGCRSGWLRVPSSATLRRSRAGDVWSGSHSGWRWPGDGEPYCCPGLWIEAPAALRGR